MSKDLYNSGGFLGKSLYNIQPSGKIPDSALSGFLNNFIGTAENTSTGAGDEIFGIITADIVNTNVINSAEEISLGTGGLLRIIPLDQQRINDAFVYGTMITTNLYSSQGENATGYTSIKLGVPYVYNKPDMVLNAINKEAPDNFLEVANSKFRVTGPFSNIKSTKVSFKAPNITLGYYDREESGLEGATTLDLKTYDKGIVMERVETNDRDVDKIKKSFMGYSQNLGRFVMYSDAVYTGTDTYKYPKMDGSAGILTGVLEEYNIDRNPVTIGDVGGNSVLEVDTIYTNNIISADRTNTRKLNLSSYDRMQIEVSRALGDTDPDKNFDLLLNVEGKIIVNSSGGEGTVQTSQNDYRIQSDTGTFINSYNPDNINYMGVPVYLGYRSMVDVDDWLRTKYISTGVVTRNKDTMVEIGGDFIASDGIGAGSKLLIDGNITGETNNDIHTLYSKQTINVPDSNVVNYVSNVTLQPLNLNIGLNSSVSTSSTLHVIGSTSNAINNYSILSSQGEVRFMGSQSVGSYMSWSNDVLNLYNSRLIVNSETAEVPVLSFGETGGQTNYHIVKRDNVDGTNELFVNGVSSRIQLEDNTTYIVRGTVTASQRTNIASFEIKYCLSINNGIKTEKYYVLDEIYGDNDTDGNRIFDVIVSYSGTSFFNDGDGLSFTCFNNNSTNTNWYGLIEVTAISKP